MFLLFMISLSLFLKRILHICAVDDHKYLLIPLMFQYFPYAIIGKYINDSIFSIFYRIIQNYALREESGTMTLERSDLNKVRYHWIQ